MPKGVEHNATAGGGGFFRVVKKSVMPKGVEHLQSGPSQAAKIT